MSNAEKKRKEREQAVELGIDVLNELIDYVVDRARSPGYEGNGTRYSLKARILKLIETAEGGEDPR